MTDKTKREAITPGEVAEYLGNTDCRLGHAAPHRIINHLLTLLSGAHEAMELMQKDLLMRGEKQPDGETLVACGAGCWMGHCIAREGIAPFASLARGEG